MSEGMGVMPAAKDAKMNDPNQGGNKSAERGGANKGIVEHNKVDSIDHAGHHSRAKAAMASMGHHNMTYHDGGER